MNDIVKIALSEPRMVEIDYKGNIIRVKPYLSRMEQEEIIEQYLIELRERSFMDAEYFLLFSLLGTCTNIQLFDLSETGEQTAAITLDDLYANWELVEKIRTAVRNFAQFYAHLQQIVKFVTDKENSLSNAISTGYTKLIDLIDHLSSTEISDEKIAQVKGLLSEIESSPILNEATKIFRLGYPQETVSPTPKKAPRKTSKKHGK